MKNVVLGVTGGIACYKAADLASRIKKNEEINLDVIMTENACKFVDPLTFRTLSKNPVVVDTFATPEAWEVGHVALAKKADILLIAPATANVIGKIANGIADDMLTTTVMAHEHARVILAPAMNVNMYENPILQKNIADLKALGYLFVEPGEGLLACGDTGKGRMAEPQDILDFMMDVLQDMEKEACKDLEPGVTSAAPESTAGRSRLDGKKILVTAGPTVEDIDPVRYISNRSSGKMGFAVAEAALARGADVTLVAGPVSLSCDPRIRRIDVRSTRDMLAACESVYDEIDIVIKAAAPADFHVVAPAEHKIKKKDGNMVLRLEENPDILETLGKKKGNRILVGFAAETRDLEKYARDKMKRKNLDLIVANNVAEPGAGFDRDTNIITIFRAADGSSQSYPQMSKQEDAEIILDEVTGLL